MACVRHALFFNMILMSESLQFAKNLPKVSTLIKEPRQVLQALNSQMSSLEAALLEKEQQSKQAIEQLKADYESQLNVQANKNMEMKHMNEVLGQRAAELHDSNQALREKARALEAATEKLKADLGSLNKNISTALEFAALALKTSGAMLNNATELNILAQLEDKDAAARENQLHQERLKEVAGAPSLLQVSAHGAKGLKDPQELLEFLMASLNDLSQEQNVSEAALNASFEQEFKAGAEKQQALAKEQADINATIADAEALHEKLLAAVGHLKEMRDGLLEKIRSLRGYARQVADAQEISKGLSLFQLAAARHAPNAHSPTALPGVSKVLIKPTEVYQLMSSHVNEFEQRLSDVEQQQAATVTKQKADYEKRLQEQADENQRIKAANLNLMIEIEALQRSSAGLRMDAKKQAATNENLRNDLEIIQKNMSSAQEFTSLALARAAGLSNASQLHVLREMEVAEAAHAHEAEHQYILSSMAKHPELGLLELTATGGAAPDPQDLLQQLLASLSDLAKEQNASAEALKAKFEKLFQEGSERHTFLLKEQAELNDKKRSENELNERLQVAVKHLKEIGSNLSKQNESIRSFLGKFGLRPEAKEQEGNSEADLLTKSKHKKTVDMKARTFLALASVSKGEVIQVASNVSIKDGSIGSAKKQRNHEKFTKKTVMQQTHAEPSVKVQKFFAEKAPVTRVNERHYITQSRHLKDTGEGEYGKLSKNAKRTKHVKQVKAKKEEPVKPDITQGGKHRKGKEQGTSEKHAKMAMPAKDVNKKKQEQAKSKQIKKTALTEAEPAKATQEEHAKTEARPSKSDAKIQNNAEVMMSRASEAAPAAWLSPLKDKISWLMR